MMYHVKKAYVDNLQNQISRLATESPKLFWIAVKKLQKETNHNKAKCIPPSIWKKHFQKLLNSPKSAKTFDNYKLELNDTLDSLFEEDEILAQINNSKTGKSSFTSVNNEMLRSASSTIVKPLKRLFDSILISHTYPKHWTGSQLLPLFKSGDTTDPDDYRGISIANPVAKIFAKCINYRLQNFLETKKLLPDNSLGFRKNMRTEDGMFLLNSAVKKYVKPKSKVFAVFIDFSKFYDSVVHDLLFRKLYSIGIRGHTLAVIISMYSEITYHIRVVKDNMWTLLQDPIRSNIGLKQGCPLSPTFANIFLFDIHRDLTLGDISVGNKCYNSISWADDLVIFTTQFRYTQNLLHKLHTYCSEMHLRINFDKTKALIFSKGKPSFYQKLLIGTRPIEYCTSYKYLGTEFQQNGSFTLACKNRVDKAQNAIFLLNSAINNGGTTSTTLHNRLFLAKIIPILMYGAPMWGPTTNLTVSFRPLSVITADKIEDLKRILSTKVSQPLAVKLLGSENKTLMVLTANIQDKINIMSRKYEGLHFRRVPEIYDMHMQFQGFTNSQAKKILGISKYANNLEANAELGWYPIQHRIVTASLKYWFRLKKGTGNGLLDAAFTYNEESSSEWMQGVKVMLADLNVEASTYDNANIPCERALDYIKARLKHKYLTYFNQKRKHSPELQNAIVYDTPYAQQDYLTVLDNPGHRNTLTKLRTNTHCLNSNYLSRFKDTVDSNCTLCSLNEEENFTHFLLRCRDSRLKKPRLDLLRYLRAISYPIHISTVATNLLQFYKGNYSNITIQNIYRKLYRLYRIRDKADLKHIAP